MIQLALTFVIALTLFASIANAKDDIPRFSLDANVVTATDNGPFVVKATLKYCGNEPICIFERCDIEAAYVTVPSNWEYHPFGRTTILMGSANLGIEKVRLNLNQSITEYLPIHRSNKRIPLGDATLVVHRRVCDPDKRNSVRLVADLSQEIRVKVERTTPDSLVGLSDRLCKILDDAGGSKEACSLAFAHLDGCPKQQLLPVAFRLLELYESDLDQYHVVRYIYELPMEETKRTKVLFDYLMKPSPRGLPAIFDCWISSFPGECPSEKNIVSLSTAPNIWVRALVAAKFPKSFDERQISCLAEEIRTYLNPSPSKEFLALLADLDSPSYGVREKATKMIIARGEAVEAMVLGALAKHPSPEAEERLRRALKEMYSLHSYSQSCRVIEVLDKIKTPESLEFLKTIGEGPTGLRSTREANDIILGLKKPVWVDER